eukprot:scaffold26763_cov116-Isochrysis_galbana.AAC.6
MNTIEVAIKELASPPMLGASVKRYREQELADHDPPAGGYGRSLHFFSSRSAAQDAELVAATIEVAEAERAERMQRTAAMAEASAHAQEVARSARLRMGWATARSRSFM